MPGQDARAEHAARAEAAERLAADCRRRLRNPLKRLTFGFLLRQARVGSAVRENTKSEAVRHLAVVRAMLLEVADRLVDRGVLDTRDDVFFLDLDELETITRDTSALDVRSLVATRHRERAINEAMTPPPIVIGGVIDPDDVAAAAAVEPSDVLTGIAVSPGCVRGPARVILRATDDAHVRAGEILVAPFTDPGWTPYFVPAAGIVMDMGGLLSHGSIVARELGKPAVVNVGPATRTIRNGQTIEVDGDNGEVRILR
jgi:pyruvate,water dikinase